MNNGCLKAVALSAAVYVIAAVVFFFILRAVVGEHDSVVPVAGTSAVCVWLASLFIKGIITLRSQKEMVHAAMEGAVPDSKRAAFIGTIDSTSRLRTPLSGQEAVAYKYRISRSSSAKTSPSLRVFFGGEAFAPLTLSMSSGRVPLLCRPHLVLATTPLSDRAQAKTHFESYAARTTFTELPRLGQQRSPSWDTPDGELHRLDERGEQAEISWQTDDLLEQVVLPREKVVLFAQYSRQRGAIIADPALGVQLLRGTPDEVITTLEKKSGFYKQAATFFIVLSIAIVVGCALWVKRKRADDATLARHPEGAPFATEGSQLPKSSG